MDYVSKELDDAMYRTGGERTVGLSHAGIVNIVVCLISDFSAFLSELIHRVCCRFLFNNEPVF